MTKFFKYYFQRYQNIRSTMITDHTNIDTVTLHKIVKYTDAEWYLAQDIYYHYVLEYGYSRLILLARQSMNQDDYHQFIHILDVCRIFQEELMDIPEEEFKEMPQPTTQVVDNGQFYLSWQYVIFTDHYIYLYHPHNLKSLHPFRYHIETSISAFNQVSSWFIKKLSAIHVVAKDRNIIKILDIDNINDCINKLTFQHQNFNLFVAKPKREHNKGKHINDAKTYIQTHYKSKYLDWLCSQQLKQYKIHYCQELLINTDGQRTFENAFIFTIKESGRLVTVVFENTNDKRSSHIFSIDKFAYDEIINDIFHFYNSTIINKREQIANRKIHDNLFSPESFRRILHTNFNKWKQDVFI